MPRFYFSIAIEFVYQNPIFLSYFDVGLSLPGYLDQPPDAYFFPQLIFKTKRKIGLISIEITTNENIFLNETIISFSAW